MQYMTARAILRQQFVQPDGAIVDMVVWLLNEPVPPCVHSSKYRLFFGDASGCRVRYDNERGKGDHCHLGDVETTYIFTTLDALLADFEQDVTHWKAS